jgi:Spy/CpxP family protein refolding chaperone
MRMAPTLFALALAVPLAAQQPDTAKHAPHGGAIGMEGMMGGGMMGHMREGMGPMMRTMAFSPEHLLMHKDALHLTDQQVARLTALRDATKVSHDAATAAMRTHGELMATVMSATAPDTAQLKGHFQAMAAAMGQAHWAMISAAAQARALLTDVQRARVDGWADVMEHMGGPGMRMREGSEDEQ